MDDAREEEENWDGAATGGVLDECGEHHSTANVVETKWTGNQEKPLSQSRKSPEEPQENPEWKS
jgi:hypothetical protein